ncbi:MAG: hypothetical protein COT92_03350 [Candidatus Doudnabacteria bacterium CG10_big_fil_rev_8_21_14_0_10_42_18]|uniref:Uncharacterized protein n=1 Tax=Candidatus Doudnabacteria bacterium CG10_big_fil_rev_8_21_14_0_10_42_18 TaxID=1974552 RepID=A0A2H0VA76_9BACT|nr:MAG: hypothetical protein COT92_03350 [Candidatus Doudnabacteria bacterium CG10_big_fil_rev_8_21_14_0_10_42_18]
MSSDDLKNIIDKIKEGEVKMRPKSYFAAKTILMVVGLVLAILVALFLSSYVFFHLKASGAFGLAGFGLDGTKDLLLSLPWLILFVVLVFVALLLWFAEHYPIAYRNPLLYSVLGILLIVLVGGYAVANTPLHPYFFKVFAPPQKAGLMHMFYARPKRVPPRNGLVGHLKEIGQGYYLIINPNGAQFKIVINNDTNFVPEEVDFEIGDVVLIHGKISGREVEAWGISKINPGGPSIYFLGDH